MPGAAEYVSGAGGAGSGLATTAFGSLSGAGGTRGGWWAQPLGGGAEASPTRTVEADQPLRGASPTRTVDADQPDTPAGCFSTASENSSSEAGSSATAPATEEAMLFASSEARAASASAWLAFNFAISAAKLESAAMTPS